jgi:poly(A) polymerase
MKINKQNIMEAKELLRLVGEAVNYECYVVGGFVRDYYLNRQNNDYDFVVLGKGPEAARQLVSYLNQRGYNPKFEVFENFGTAHVKWDDNEVEFVGARRENYERGSRKPIVEDGTLVDDLTRRDFTINALAIQVSPVENFGKLVDLFDGRKALEHKIIDTPTDPDITFSDDPLRILRGIRFSVKLGFRLATRVVNAMIKNRDRLSIVSKERVITELNKIMTSDNPAEGFRLLHMTGILKRYLPELVALDGKRAGHKNNLEHSFKVLEQLSEKSDSLWLRWAALLHDIGKATTAQRNENGEWTFYQHENVGARMIPDIFRRLGLPMGAEMRYVQLMIEMHMRPGFISTHEIKDSAVRRLISDAGENNIDDLLLLGESDITSGIPEKRARVQHHYNRLKYMVQDLQKRDAIRLFQPVLKGEDIMQAFNIKPGRQVGEIKALIKDAVLDGVVDNTKEDLIQYIKDNWNFK